MTRGLSPAARTSRSTQSSRSAPSSASSSARGRECSRGLDAEISGSLTDRWQVYAGYTFNRSTNRSSVGDNVESRRKGYNFSSHTPKHMFRLYTSYILPIDDGKWTVGLGVKSSSKTAKGIDAAQ